MSWKSMIYLLATVAFLAALFLGWKLTARSGYESAKYTVLESEGSFEIRDYPDLMLATTAMKPESQGNDGSFSRLFGYISGGNDDEQKVAMTTPVFMEREGSEAVGQMGFVIPEKIATEGIPKPSNENVRIQKRAGGQFAVFRFSGRMNDDVKAKSEGELRQWMDLKGFKGSKDAEFAGYDPPWTPGLFRRNEVLVRLQ